MHIAPPTVIITTDRNNDGILVQSETAAGKIEASIAIDTSELAKGGSVEITIVSSLQTTQVRMNQAGQFSGLAAGMNASYDPLTGMVSLSTPLPGNDKQIKIEARQEDEHGHFSPMGFDRAAQLTVAMKPTAELDPISDKGAQGDNITTVRKPGIIGLGQEGDTIEVTFPGGKVVTTTVDANGQWRVTPDTNLALGSNPVQVVAINELGNRSDAVLVPLVIADTTPKVTIVTDSNNDGVITGAELAGNSQISVKVELPYGSKAGSILSWNDGTGDHILNLTQGQINSGQVILNVDKPAAGASLLVSVKITTDGEVSAPGQDSAQMASEPLSVTSITPAQSSVVEGGVLSYAVKLSGDASVVSSFAFSVGGGSASKADYGAASFSNGVTYNAVTGMVTVPPGVTAFTVSLPTVNDKVHESKETLNLSVGGKTVSSMIYDNDIQIEGRVHDKLKVTQSVYGSGATPNGDVIVTISNAGYKGSWHPSWGNESLVFRNGGTLTLTAKADAEGNWSIPVVKRFCNESQVVATDVTAGSKHSVKWISPLILDLNGDGVHTVAMQDGANFDLNADGKSERTGWVDKHDGLLALDLNQDGQINDGRELFGNATSLADGSKAQDGFAALAQYDDNQDGVIDQRDTVHASLQVWVDKDGDGQTGQGELLSLAQAGVAAINLAAQASDGLENSNLLGLVGSYTTTDGESREAVDVWFQSEEAAPVNPVLQDKAAEANTAPVPLQGVLDAPSGGVDALLAQLPATAPTAATTEATPPSQPDTETVSRPHYHRIEMDDSSQEHLHFWMREMTHHGRWLQDV